MRDLRERRGPAGPAEIEWFEADVFAGFVLARLAVGLSDGTIRSDVSNLEQVRAWFGRPLRDMEPGDADGDFGTVPRAVQPNTRIAVIIVAVKLPRRRCDHYEHDASHADWARGSRDAVVRSIGRNPWVLVGVATSLRCDEE